MKHRVVFLTLLSLVLISLPMFSQTDPGVRTVGPTAGAALTSVAADSPTTILGFFNDGKSRFQETDSVSGAITGENGFGLGPRYNSRSCAECHSQPNTGGSSPSTNPQVADATADGATNTVPSFITSTGPIREARFIYFTTGAGIPITTAPNGGVEDLYTIAGRSDAGSCTSATISQPDFATAITQNNIIYRIPTPLFGAGLVENVDETTLLALQAANAGNAFGVAGTFNHNGNDGTISRFGWKAQNKSLEIFSGEAYNVEMGVSNELFTQERPTPDEDMVSGLPNPCKINPTPEDHTNFNTTAVLTPSDAVQFAMFMRLLDAPHQDNHHPGSDMSRKNGETQFETIGCRTCHETSSSTTASRITSSLSSVSFKPYSDFEIHHMGTGLADNVSQGTAGGDQFRTAPLWGLGQRIFFLHDGRETNLINAINDHYSSGSEANTAVLNYLALSSTNQQDILNFLRSL